MTGQTVNRARAVSLRRVHESAPLAVRVGPPMTRLLWRCPKFSFSISSRARFPPHRAPSGALPRHSASIFIRARFYAPSARLLPPPLTPTPPLLPPCVPPPVPPGRVTPPPRSPLPPPVPFCPPPTPRPPLPLPARTPSPCSLFSVVTGAPPTALLSSSTARECAWRLCIRNIKAKSRPTGGNNFPWCVDSSISLGRCRSSRARVAPGTPT